MTKPYFLKKVSVILAVIFIFSTVIISLPTAVSAATIGTAYYVDSVSGKDSNSGTNINSPWQSLAKVNTAILKAGDSVLFKRGSSWTGNLYPQGSGASGSPITIDAYGTGSLPIINGGESTTAPGSNATVDSAIYLCNQSFITIQNLEITNFSASDPSMSSTRGAFSGIHLDGSGSGTLCQGLTIQNCYIHNIAGDTTAVNTAAIVIFNTGYYTPYNNVLIQNNDIENALGSGMILNVNNFVGTGNGTNLVVQNNSLHNIGGNGINVLSATSPLVQNNIIDNSCCALADTIYDAGLWPFSCENALMQNNEVYNTQTTHDGFGIDSDYQCHNSTFQYNYVHDNQGGFLNICCEPQTWDKKTSWNDGTIIRYNIAQNNLNTTIALYTKITNSYIYNNTIYIGSGSSANVVATGSRDNKTWPKNTYFYNNIIYNYGSGTYSFGGATGTVWNYNTFYGNHPSAEPSDAHKLTTDPMLVSPGSAGIGINTCGGYRLKPGSPALNSGILVSNNGGKDFFGNTVSSAAAPNRGAYNGAGTNFTNQYTVNGTYLQNLTVGMSVSSFISSFSPGSNTVITVSDKNGSQVTSGIIGTGMTVNIVVNGSTAAQYTLLIYGDVDGNGKIDSHDLLLLKYDILNRKQLTGVYLEAANTDRDSGDNVNSSDLVSMKNQILRESAISQNQKAI